jgi:hypothetical protein
MEVVAVPARIDVDNAAEVLENLRKATEGAVGCSRRWIWRPCRISIPRRSRFCLQLARERGLSAAGASQTSGSAVPLFLLNPRESSVRLLNSTASRRCFSALRQAARPGNIVLGCCFRGCNRPDAARRRAGRPHPLQTSRAPGSGSVREALRFANRPGRLERIVPRRLVRRPPKARSHELKPLPLKSIRS